MDFHVTRRYVFNLYTVGKLSMEACRAECAATRDGVLAAHRELDFQKKLENDAYVEARAEQIAMLLASSKRAFKPHTTTVLAFMAQFTPENYGVLKRSKPLVLTGPTRVAKSSYLESLYGIAATLTVNCPGVEEPPLQDFVGNRKSIAPYCLRSATGVWYTETNCCFKALINQSSWASRAQTSISTRCSCISCHC